MSNKLTTEEFIKRAKSIHGDHYDYSLVKYINTKVKVAIICPIHGEFLQSCKHHFAGSGCPKCGAEKSKKFKVSQEQFLERAKSAHGDKYDYSKAVYKNNKEKVIIICPIHGEFKINPLSHTQGIGCKKCSGDIMSLKFRDTQESFIEKAKAAHGDFYDYSLVKYINQNKEVDIICPIHGVFSQRAGVHALRKNGCPNCGHNVKSLKFRLSLEEFIEKAKNVHGDRYDYSLVEYVNGKTKVLVICPHHGSFLTNPNLHIHQGAGCPECALINTGWTYTKWEDAGFRSFNFDGFKLYVLKCWNDDEVFYKIGKTFQTIGARFNSKRTMPYEFEVLKTVEGSARYISELEAELHRKHGLLKHTPKIRFGGDFECFTQYLE